MIFRSFFPLGKRLLNNDVDRASVLGMHADKAAVLRGGLQRLKDAGIVEHKHAGICHEKLEARHALIYQRIHLLQLRTAEIGHNAVK